MASFTFNDVSSLDMGVYVEEDPVIPSPAPRVSFQTVPGRSGSLTILEGDNIYDDILITINCFALFDYGDFSDVTTIMNWLRGSGKLVLSGRAESGWYYQARVVNQVDFSQIMRHKGPVRFAVTFRCEPFIRTPRDTRIALSTGTVVTFSGSGTEETGPLLTLTSNVTAVTATINDTELYIKKRTLGSVIYVDCDSKVAYNDDGDNLTNEITGDWPVVKPSTNTVKLTGTFVSAYLNAFWRKL